MAEKYVAKSELDSALEGLCKKYNVSYGEESMGFGRELAELSDQLATADIFPVVHGHWKPIFDTEGNKRLGRAMHYECSRCGRTVKDETYSYSLDYEICPHCGAEMDEEEEW